MGKNFDEIDYHIIIDIFSFVPIIMIIRIRSRYNHHHHHHHYNIMNEKFFFSNSLMVVFFVVVHGFRFYMCIYFLCEMMNFFFFRYSVSMTD